MKFRYTAEEKAMLWLDSFSLTYHQKEELLSVGSALEIVKGVTAENREICSRIPEDELLRMRSALRDETYLPALLEGLEEKDIFFVTPSSAEYPPLLKPLPARPLILYCKGRRELLTTEHFSIVGSRRILPWARKLTESVAAEIAAHFTVVTGFAEGGDESVIRGVLSSSKGDVPLICVFANGFDFVYPASHTSFMREVEKRGLLVSEFRPDIRPQKFLFPVRNRILAGLSRGVLIVGAAKRSGTSFTAGYALEYGRDVFAFPYNPGISEGEGCNALIRAGAYLATSATDVLSTYGISVEEIPMPEMTADEERVWRLLREEGELHVEAIGARLDLPSYVVAGILSGLEVKGLVVRAGGNRYGIVSNAR